MDENRTSGLSAIFFPRERAPHINEAPKFTKNCFSNLLCCTISLKIMGRRISLSSAQLHISRMNLDLANRVTWMSCGAQSEQKEKVLD